MDNEFVEAFDQFDANKAGRETIGFKERQIDSFQFEYSPSTSDSVTMAETQSPQSDYPVVNGTEYQSFSAKMEEEEEVDEWMRDVYG